MSLWSWISELGATDPGYSYRREIRLGEAHIRISLMRFEVDRYAGDVVLLEESFWTVQGEAECLLSRSWGHSFEEAALETERCILQSFSQFREIFYPPEGKAALERILGEDLV